MNPFPNKPLFWHVCSTSLLKTLWEKEKLLVTSNFSFFRSVFYPSRELSAISIEFRIVVCRLFQFGSLNFVVWERVKLLCRNFLEEIQTMRLVLSRFTGLLALVYRNGQLLYNFCLWFHSWWVNLKGLVLVLCMPISIESFYAQRNEDWWMPWPM